MNRGVLCPVCSWIIPEECAHPYVCERCDATLRVGGKGESRWVQCARRTWRTLVYEARKRIDEDQAYIDWLEATSKILPDLRAPEQEFRYMAVSGISSTAKDLATECWLQVISDPDSANAGYVVLTPYTVINGRVVVTDPYKFCVGFVIPESENLCAEMSSGIIEHLHTSGIRDEILQKVKDFFALEKERWVKEKSAGKKNGGARGV